MKNILLIFLAGAFFLFQGCEGYLDKTPDSEGMTEEEVFTNYLNFRQFQDNMYNYMHDYLNQFDQSFIAALSDEGYTESDWEAMPVVQNGNWLAAYETGGAEQFINSWETWEAIRIANISIQNIPMLEGNASAELMDELKGQAHFMRAWYYFEFLRRQGGMPYITEPLEPTDNFALPRLSAYETAKLIAADCDTAASLLPEEWGPSNIGRPTMGAALALKATVLLFGASPNNNPSNDVSRWEEAANASWAFIDYAESTGQYRLLPSNGTATAEYLTPGGVQSITYPSGRDSVFMYQPTNDEIIWEHYASSTPNANKYVTFGTASLTNRGFVTGFSPSQNTVDRFETINGLAIEDDPDYDSDNPYIDRDPRFYQSILFNQRRHADTYLELFNGGSERPGEKYHSYTGYLSNKYWPSYVHSGSGAQPPITHTIYLRYADLLLQYAEATNEIGGPNHAVTGSARTAVDAVNMVRDRVNMPPVANQYLADKATFRERIKNERAVELYLEGKRLFDLMRWGDAHKLEHRQVYAADITENSSAPTGYNIQKSSTPVITLTFEQRHYRWPIPATDANMFEEFKQNPGW